MTITEARDALEALRPLENVRVTSLALNLPGPVAAARLVRLGARVIQIVPPAGDPMESYNPDFYRLLHADQEIIGLDLKNPGDREKFEAILATTDVLLTAFRPAALERLSLGWMELHARHPRLCQVALVGDAAGAENVPGHDLTYQAACGLLSPPAMPLTLYTDMASAERMVSTTLALLLARARSQQGGYAQVVMTAVTEDFALPLYRGMTAPGGFLGGGSPFYNLYRARDGWVAVAALEPHFQKRLLAELHLESAVYEKFSSIFAERAAAEWHRWAAERDLPLVAVRTLPHVTPAAGE